MLTEHPRHTLRVIIEGDLGEQVFADDAAYVAIGGDRASESEEPWDATLPNPFLGTDLQTAVQQANQSRLGATRVQTLSS